MVLVPVSDVDRAKTFYAEKVGSGVDFDGPFSEEVRVVQLSPSESGCSIQVGRGDHGHAPGSLGGLQLVVPDLETAQAELVERGVEASGIQVYCEDGLRPRREGETLDNVGFVYSGDPDGNRWTVQQLSARG